MCTAGINTCTVGINNVNTRASVVLTVLISAVGISQNVQCKELCTVQLRMSDLRTNITWETLGISPPSSQCELVSFVFLKHHTNKTIRKYFYMT